MKNDITPAEAAGLIAQCQATVERGDSRIAKVALQMVQAWEEGQIDAAQLLQVIEETYSRVEADVDGYLAADVRNVLVPWPSETLETLMAVRIGQHALCGADAPECSQHELRQMQRLLQEHGEALRMERKAREEAQRQNKSVSLLLVGLVAAFTLPAMRASADPTTRDYADELETIVQGMMAGLEGQSNKALDFLPRTPRPSTSSSRGRNRRRTVRRPYNPSGLLAALESFEQGDPEEQRRTLEYLEVALDRDRPGQRRIFGEGINPPADKAA